MIYCAVPNLKVKNQVLAFHDSGVFGIGIGLVLVFSRSNSSRKGTSKIPTRLLRLPLAAPSRPCSSDWWDVRDVALSAMSEIDETPGSA